MTKPDTQNVWLKGDIDNVLQALLFARPDWTKSLQAVALALGVTGDMLPQEDVPYWHESDPTYTAALEAAWTNSRDERRENR